MALFLLAGGDDQGRAGEIRREQRAHGVAQAGRHMHIHRRDLARGTGVAIGHGNDDGFLQAKDIADIRLLGHGMHDGQFRGAGIAEQPGHALVLQKGEKGTAAGDGVAFVIAAHDRPFGETWQDARSSSTVTTALWSVFDWPRAFRAL